MTRTAQCPGVSADSMNVYTVRGVAVPNLLELLSCRYKGKMNPNTWDPICMYAVNVL